MIIKSGQYYTNIKNSQIYQVHSIAYDVTNNQEKEVVVYSSMYNSEQFYVRELQEFIDKFTDDIENVR